MVEALQPEFKDYAKQIIINAQVLAQSLENKGLRIISGGTDNHLLLVDVFGSCNVTGKEAEHALEFVGISANKNMIPFDTRKPLDPSGIRLGTAAVTTRGMRESEMILLADYIYTAIRQHADLQVLGDISVKVKNLALKFPVPGIAKI